MTRTSKRNAAVLALAAALALGVLVLLALVEAKPAKAAFPGANGPIVYDGSDSSGNSQIFTIPASGGTPTQLTNDAKSHFDPDWGVAPQPSGGGSEPSGGAHHKHHH